MVLLTFFAAFSASAKPRPPLPPFPEMQLWSWRFDDPAWVARPSSNVLAAENLAVAESWSGYALDMTGEPSGLLVLPMVSGSVRPNLAAHSGTVRFWFAPQWSSVGAGGSGPGDWVRLLEIGRPGETDAGGAASLPFWITLAIDATGSVLTLAGKADGQPLFHLQAALTRWQAMQWHQIAVVYSPSNTMLVVDGRAVAATENRLPWPDRRHFPEVGFAIGSGLAGEDAADGQFEELTTFAFPLSLEYLAWQYEQLAPLAAMGPITEEEMAQRRAEREMMMTTADAPPPPGGGGGGGGGGGSGGVTNAPYSVPGLKLTQPVISGSVLATRLMEADTNSAYDIFERAGLHQTNAWARVAVGDIGQTNFSLMISSTNQAFFMAAAVVDSDFDGIPDSFEELVLRTSALSGDSDGDGIPDGDEDVNGNGVPDYVDYNGLTRAIVYASRANAYEGGQAGEITVRLPSSAPANNTKVTLHLGGNVDYDGDYWLAKLNGTRVTNDVFFVIGEREIRLQVHASNDLVQASSPRRVSVALAASADYQLDPHRADVNLIDNDLPTVSIAANDAKASEPNGTNTNPGLLIARRDGILTNALTVLASVSGSATGGVDCTNVTTPLVFPAGTNVLTIPINPIHDTNYEGAETVVLTLQANAAYQIDASAPTGMVTIADNDLPLVYFEATDRVATEYNNRKAATLTLRRTGNTSQTLTVPLAIAGTAVNGMDYELLGNTVTFGINASSTNLSIRPLTDTLTEPAETVILTIQGSLQHAIGSSNSVTAFIDDDHATSYTITMPKQSSVYAPANGVDSPAIIEVRRFGMSAQAVNLGFTVKTNTQSGPQPTTYYRATGDVSGTNAVFAAFATQARLRFSAPGPVNQSGGAVDVTINVAPYQQSVWSVFFQPTWQALKFSIVETNVVEGAAVQGRVRLSRGVTAPVAMSVQINVSGHATPSGFSGADHTLGQSFFINLAANATSVDQTFTASTDGAVEGWESIVFTPSQGNIEIVFDEGVRYMGFVRENVASPEFLPQGDYDLDGLPDRWELANGLDPFTAGEALLDPDKDGLVTLDEYEFNTNPNSDDSDGDGQKDFGEASRALDLDPDYVAIRLQTRDTGKVNNGMNCAVCHTTQLKVGEFGHFTRTPNRGQFTDKTFYFRKGTNYPIYLSELVQNLSPTTQNTGNPTTTATYTAAVLPANGAPRAFVVQDPQAKLGTNKPWSSFPADPGASVGTLIVPRIEVSWTNVSGNVALDANTNWGGGVRMFPDALNPTDTTPRNTVTVLVQTTPPVSGQSVRLKAFDVDDPTPPDLNPGGVLDANDIFQLPSGNDNRGTPQAGQLAQTVLTLDSQGKATTGFTVSRQPGDNFRVAAVLDTGAAATNHLNLLQVTSENAEYYVGSDTNAIPGFLGGISPMLTVWRKLHLEFDSMAAPAASGPEANFVSGTITHVKLNSPVAGRSRIAVGHTQPWVNGAGQFAAGKIEISGVGTFAVTNGGTFTSSLDNRSSTGLDVLGTPAGNLIGLSAKVYDDDERYLANDFPLYESLVNLPSPPLPANGRSGEFVNAMQFRFDPAYVRLVDANAQGWNATQTIPFRRNAAAVTPTGSSVFDAGNLDLKGKDKPEFWCFSICFGYQPETGDDGDGHDEIPLLGGTPKTSPWLIGDRNRPFGYSVIFLESIRDYRFGVGRKGDPDPIEFKISAGFHRGRYTNWLHGIIAHELGHAPGRQTEATDHDEAELMQQGGSPIDEDFFLPLTIRRFRSAPSWTQ